MNNIFKQNSQNASFQVTSNLLNSEHMNVAITQLCYELQVCNFTMLYLTKKLLNNMFIQISVSAIVFKL